MMQVQSLLVGIALLRLSTTTPLQELPQNLTSRQWPTEPCAEGLHLIGAGGRGSADPLAMGRLGSLSDSIVRAIPGSTFNSLPYDKLWTRENPMAIPDGVTNLITYVNDYHSQCPNTKIALIGYSSGAIITMNGICGGGVTADKNIIAVVVYGDQTRSVGAPYNLGTCSGIGGRHPRDPAACAAFTTVLQSYCNWNDPECCGGQDANEHFVYPAQYDAQATGFVVNRYWSS